MQTEHVKKEDHGGNQLIQIYLQSGPLKRCIPEPLPKYLLASVATENVFVEYYIKIVVADDISEIVIYGLLPARMWFIWAVTKPL